MSPLLNRDSKSVVKTRNLPLSEFFVRLQEEYIVAELRKKIYPKTKDKIYYEKVMKYKKEKIDDIVIRNCLPSIFTNEKTKEKFYSKIYNKTGYPNFLYKDNQEQELLEITDRENYYSINSEASIIIDNQHSVGVIKSVDSQFKTIEIEIDGTLKSIDIKLITRII